MRHIILIFVTNFAFIVALFAQDTTATIATATATSTAAADTTATPNYELGEIVVQQEYEFANEKEREEYKELKNDLYKIYPLVVLVEKEYDRINAEMELYEGKRQKDFLKWSKGYVKENYMHYLSGLNHRQGRLLLKLISRQIGETPYILIKEYLNGFNAVIWQMTSHLFLANLKVDYKPEENPMIEHIMVEMEANRDVVSIQTFNGGM
jgi:hypothetical protein